MAMPACTDPAHAHTKRAALLDRLRPYVPADEWDAVVVALDDLLLQMTARDDAAPLGSCL